jgi:hypothetical protein
VHLSQGDVKKIFWIILIAVFLGFWVSAISFKYAFRGFVHDEPGRGIRFVEEIPFDEVEIENFDERLKLLTRVRNFFAEHVEFQVPANLNLDLQWVPCGDGCVQQWIYFEDNPLEIYQVVFFSNSTDTTSGDNFIRDVYVRKEGQFVLLNNMQLDDNEKERIRVRLRTAILDKIDWTLK